MSAPTEALDTIFQAVKTNLARITVTNSFNTTVGLVDELDAEVRDEDFETGKGIILITDQSEEYEYRTAGFVRAYNVYLVTGFLKSETSVATVRTSLRDFQTDFWVAHHYDRDLSKAHLANGGSLTPLVVTHNIVAIRRFYQPPEGMFVARVEMTYDFNSDSA